MAESSGAADEQIVNFHVKSSGGQKFTLSLPLSTTTVDLKNKLASSEYANVPASSQRLIYSGKVLKDADTLATHNVKEGNTMHLVKSAASNQRQNPANQQSSTGGNTESNPSPAAGVPQNLASGTGNDPLAGLTGARYAGFAQLPNASMFQNPPTPEEMVRQLQDPNFAQMMREAMNNPQIIDMMINANPQLRSMGPGARQILQSDEFRRFMTDPNAMRMMMQAQEAFGMDSTGGMGGRQEAFPAPGVTNTTNPQNVQNAQTGQTQQQQQPQPPQNPFAPTGPGMAANPFASLFNPLAMQNPSMGTNPTQSALNNPTDTTSPNPQNPQQPSQQPPNPFAALFQPTAQQGTNNPSSPPPYGLQGNPFMQNPEAMNQFLQAMRDRNGAGAGAGGAGGGDGIANIFDLLAGGGAAAPADNRPPEERYAVGLRQLNEMGFHDFDRNIQALSRSGGDINGALEWLFNNSS